MYVLFAVGSTDTFLRYVLFPVKNILLHFWSCTISETADIGADIKMKTCVGVAACLRYIAPHSPKKSPSLKSTRGYLRGCDFFLPMERRGKTGPQEGRYIFLTCCDIVFWAVLSPFASLLLQHCEVRVAQVTASFTFWEKRQFATKAVILLSIDSPLTVLYSL